MSAAHCEAEGVQVNDGLYLCPVLLSSRAAKMTKTSLLLALTSSGGKDHFSFRRVSVRERWAQRSGPEAQ